MDVSVSAMRYRAFVFAAPPHFVAGIRSRMHRSGFSWCGFPARGNASKKFFLSL